jgi:GR25 family glycosyltransferase involved in LPS biosynthesis
MRFIYADPALVDNLGHPAAICRYVTRELGNRGIKAEVFGFRAIRPELKAELGAQPHFRAHTYAADDPDPIFGWLKSFDATTDITREDLQQLPALDPGDLIYFNSAQAGQLMATIQWMATLPPERLPQVVLELGHDPGLDITVSPTGFSCTARDPRRDPSAAFYRLAGSKISPRVKEHLHLMTFERQTSTIFGTVIGHPVGLFPPPFAALAPLRSRSGNTLLTLAVLGHQRAEKGYSLVPAIARRVLEQRGQVRILVHNGAPEQMPEAQHAVRALASLDRRIVLDERTVGPATWAELLESSDIILCPYDPNRFRARHSGVAFEAVANAIPLVGPAGTSIERLIQECGGCGTVFGEFEPNSIAAATVSAMDNFDRYASAAYTAAEQWPSRYGPNRLVDALLAFAQSSPAECGRPSVALDSKKETGRSPSEDHVGAVGHSELESALRVHVINLDRNSERLREFQTVNKHLKGVERFSAVDGQKLDVGDLAQQGLLSIDLLHPDFYSIGAIGNAMSHLSLWDHVLKTGKPATIAEDDAIFNFQFDRSAAGVLGRLPPDWDIIYWGYNFDLFMMFQMLPGTSPCIATFDQQQLRAGVSNFQTQAIPAHPFPLTWAFGTVCYSISPKGARVCKSKCIPLRPMILEIPEVARTYPYSDKYRTVALDSHLNSFHWRIKSYVCFPPLAVTKNEHSTSTVQTAQA